MEPFTVRAPFASDLSYLLELVTAGELDPQIGLRTSWVDVADAAGKLLSRQVAGKAVLDLL